MVSVEKDHTDTDTPKKNTDTDPPSLVCNMLPVCGSCRNKVLYLSEATINTSHSSFLF